MGRAQNPLPRGRGRALVRGRPAAGGRLLSALLSRRLPTTESLQYYVDVIDRGFANTRQPEARARHATPSGWRTGVAASIEAHGGLGDADGAAAVVTAVATPLGARSTRPRSRRWAGSDPARVQLGGVILSSAARGGASGRAGRRRGRRRRGRGVSGSARSPSWAARWPWVAWRWPRPAAVTETGRAAPRPARPGDGRARGSGTSPPSRPASTSAARRRSRRTSPCPGIASAATSPAVRASARVRGS